MQHRAVGKSTLDSRQRVNRQRFLKKSGKSWLKVFKKLMQYG
jgi:hypothetical protein